MVYDREVYEGPFTGRVYVFFSERNDQPRTGPEWFSPEPFIARDVQDWAAGEVLSFSQEDAQHVLSFPEPWPELQLSGYTAQAVVRFNPLERQIGTGPGNGFSSPVKLPAEDTDSNNAPSNDHVVRLKVDQRVPQRSFRETRWSRLLRVRSEQLSQFHGRDVYLQAAVLLPASYYRQPDRKYPTIYTIPGFGGRHFSASRDEPVAEENDKGIELLRVVLDPSSPWGHHVFANSAVNGPVGDALVQELIPHYERQFRAIAEPEARFLTGHSSGGWSSLWLQVTYPDFFGGVWSTAPDAIDFRYFQGINIYEPGANAYVDQRGEIRPLARRGEKPVLWFRHFDEMETVLGPGGQLKSFEAVFSPRAEAGGPQPLWNRETGAIDPQVAQAWAKYDIHRILRENWEQLEPKLEGKLHVIMGGLDTFYLDQPVRNLKETMSQLDADVDIEVIEKRDHFNLLNIKVLQRMRRQMVETFLKNYPDYP